MEATVQDVIKTIVQQFTKEELGNRVTPNNMLALSMKIDMAFDGKITLQAPEERAAEEK